MTTAAMQPKTVYPSKYNLPLFCVGGLKRCLSTAKEGGGVVKKWQITRRQFITTVFCSCQQRRREEAPELRGKTFSANRQTNREKPFTENGKRGIFFEIHYFPLFPGKKGCGRKRAEKVGNKIFREETFSS